MHSALLTLLLRLRQCCDHFILTQSSATQQADTVSDDATGHDDTDSARVAAMVERSASTHSHQPRSVHARTPSLIW